MSGDAGVIDHEDAGVIYHNEIVKRNTTCEDFLEDGNCAFCDDGDDDCDGCAFCDDYHSGHSISAKYCRFGGADDVEPGK